MLRGAYEDCIRGLDHEIGQLLKQLERRQELDNTIIIVTADHGEHCAEHDLFLHGISVYEPLLHVPLIVSWPGRIPGGVRVSEPVALNGVPHTVCELIDEPQTFPGRSWVPHWSDGGSSASSHILVAELASQSGFPPCHGRSPICRHGSIRCVREGDLKYIRANDFTEELYNLRKDPAEQHNLVNDPRHADDLLRLRKYCNRRNSFDDCEAADADLRK